ncbi:hypothetical protein [Ornithinimicrobium cavernae]|uniref:hypothetical protein n=1 Tax=Ornithinimicrobium cavernae TaxID=2666047 RepID=UPI0012B17731|nr:hypothetical protein [Ornithinimicrobium cavernae]
MTEAGRITARAALAFLLATWPRRLLLALLLLVPVVVAASGGLRVADPPPLTVAPEVVTDTGAYRVVPRHYFVSDRVDAGSLDEGVRWVGAVAQITNQGSEPISVTGSDETFRLPVDVPDDDLDAPYEVLRLDTGSRLGSAQPGVTYEVALLWRTTGLEDPPPALTLTLHETAWTRWNIEAGFSSWRATAHRSEVDLPLGEAPASILEEDE